MREFCTGKLQPFQIPVKIEITQENLHGKRFKKMKVLKIKILKSFRGETENKAIFRKIILREDSHLEEFENIILSPRFGNPYLIISESESEISGSMKICFQENSMDWIFI